MDKVEKCLTEYYSSVAEKDRLASRHGQVEFLTTIRYVEKYLRPGDRILEIGAGPGRYSHYFARKGYPVEAVELVERNIELFREETWLDEDITVRQGNAVDLSGIPDNRFDITLMLGPMYHLYSEEDKMAALSEAIRVTKPGGVLFAAYCNSDASILSYGFWRGNYKLLLEKGMLEAGTFQTHSRPEDIFELYRKEDIDSLMNNFPVQRLHYVAADMGAAFLREMLAAMDEESFEDYMKYHFFCCERPDMVGITNHILDVFRK